MSKVKIIFLGLFVSCILVQAQDYDWKRVPIDGSRTGCVATSADNIDEALGTIDKRGNYHSPSGEVYSKHSATAKVARVVIDAQPVMASVKKVIAFSEEEMPHKRITATKLVSKGNLINLIKELKLRSYLCNCC